MTHVTNERERALALICRLIRAESTRVDLVHVVLKLRSISRNEILVCQLNNSPNGSGPIQAGRVYSVLYIALLRRERATKERERVERHSEGNGHFSVYS